MAQNNWHNFRENEVGDDTCTRCEVQVTAEAHMTFTLPCPAGDCPSTKNPDRGCAFHPTGSEPARCLYCGRPGDRESLEDTSAIEEEFGVGDPDAADLA